MNLETTEYPSQSGRNVLLVVFKSTQMGTILNSQKKKIKKEGQGSEEKEKAVISFACIKNFKEIEKIRKVKLKNISIFSIFAVNSSFIFQSFQFL